MDGDTAMVEVNNFDSWTMENRMFLNLSKTWEMIMSGKAQKPLPPKLNVSNG